MRDDITYELNEKQVKALFTFAQTFDFGDLHDMIKDMMSEEEIYNLDCVLNDIHLKFIDLL